jgi:hypothetical protein
MACGKRTRIKNLFIAPQSGDTYTEPTQAQNIRIESGFVAQATPEQIERDILKASLTPDVNLTGIKIMNASGVSEMFGADYTNGTTKPWFNDIFNASQLTEKIVKKIPVSAIATHFVYGEIVSGATGVGRVVVPTVAGDTAIYVQVTTAGFIAETITGSVAGSATATGAEVNAGWSYKYDSNICKRLSCRVEEDGLISKSENAVPTMSISCDAGNIPKVNFELNGSIYNDGAKEFWRIDGAMTDLVGYRSEVIPPRFIGARLKLDSYVPIVDGTMTIDPQTTNKLRVDANELSGANGYIITGRGGIMTFRISTPTQAEIDLFADWFSSKAVAIEFRFGKEEGNTFWFHAPTARYQNITDADDDGEMKQELEFSLTGQDDQELEIICI